MVEPLWQVAQRDHDLESTPEFQLAVRSAQAQLMAAADARSGDMAEPGGVPDKKVHPRDIPAL